MKKSKLYSSIFFNYSAYSGFNFYSSLDEFYIKNFNNTIEQI